MNVDLKGLSKADADVEMHFWFTLDRAPILTAFDINLVPGGTIYSKEDKLRRLRKIGRRTMSSHAGTAL